MGWDGMGFGSLALSSRGIKLWRSMHTPPLYYPPYHYVMFCLPILDAAKAIFRSPLRCMLSGWNLIIDKTNNTSALLKPSTEMSGQLA